MKKWIMTVAVAAMLLGAGNTASAHPILERIALYPVNLIADALDTFTINIGFGPVVEARLQATYAVWVGGNAGMSWKMYKAYNRQYGFGQEQGYYWQFISIGQEDMSVSNATRLVNQYTETRTGFPPRPNRNVYDWQTGARDYWAIGGSLGGLIIGDLYIHPIEIADFITGIFLYDLKGDDLYFDDFR